MLGIGTVFVKHPTTDEGFLMDYFTCRQICEEYVKKLGNDAYSDKIKETIYNELKEYEIKPLTYTEYQQLPDLKPYMIEY